MKDNEVTEVLDDEEEEESAENDEDLIENDETDANDTDQPVLQEFQQLDDVSLPPGFKCSSHTLNLVASADINKILETNKPLKKQHDQTIERCSVLWSLRGRKRREKLKDTLKFALKRPVVVRWNSIFDSLVQIDANEEKVKEASFVLNQCAKQSTNYKKKKIATMGICCQPC